MSQFAVTVVNRTTLRTAGMKVRTSMEHAARDCPHLWDVVFCPHMADFPADPERAQESYGVSVMIDEDIFDYWAVIPLNPSFDAPDGMDILELPGGPYAECRIPSLETLADGYTYLYSEWAPAQQGYAVDFSRAALELYTPDFRVDGSLTLYCPLLEK